jgi:hypothetical protein
VHVSELKPNDIEKNEKSKREKARTKKSNHRVQAGARLLFKDRILGIPRVIKDRNKQHAIKWAEKMKHGGFANARRDAKSCGGRSGLRAGAESVHGWTRIIGRRADLFKSSDSSGEPKAHRLAQMCRTAVN